MGWGGGGCVPPNAVGQIRQPLFQIGTVNTRFGEFDAALPSNAACSVMKGKKGLCDSPLPFSHKGLDSGSINRMASNLNGFDGFPRRPVRFGAMLVPSTVRDHQP
jgi:hypothetical protein